MARKPRKVRTEEEIFLDKLKKMEEIKKEYDEKLIDLGKQFFKEYNSFEYDTVLKRITEKYTSNPFERRKHLTEEQENMLYEKFNTTDLEKIMEQIKVLNLNESVPSESDLEEISAEDKEALTMIKELKEGYGTSDIPTIIQKIQEEIQSELQNGSETEQSISSENLNYLRGIAEELREGKYIAYGEVFEEIKNRF